jgi:hypothetical protein
VTQAGECLHDKCEALSSKPSTTKQKEGIILLTELLKVATLLESNLKKSIKVTMYDSATHQFPSNYIS